MRNFFYQLGQFSILFTLASCASQSIVVKTEKNYNEKQVAVETLYEFGPTDYLRGEYAKNTSLTESKISKISAEMRAKKLFFADAQKSTEHQGQALINAGDEVTIVAKSYIVPIGDFYQIETTQGQFLVKDNEQKLLSKEEYQKLQLKNVETTEVVVNAANPQEVKHIDYFNSATEEERLSKIKWFCSKYPQYKKFQSNAEKKQLTIGMPEHLLGLSWGQPARVKEDANETGVYRSFYYPGNYVVITRNTIINSWKKVE
mgnify:CR=1 FL=1